MFDYMPGNVSADIQPTVYETGNGSQVLQLFGRSVEEDSIQLFIPDDNHPEGGVLTRVYRLNTTSISK